MTTTHSTLNQETADDLENKIAENPRDEILKFFRFGHLPEGPLRNMSAAFADAAMLVVIEAKPCAERTVALRKLLEGKDAAVRACLP